MVLQAKKADEQAKQQELIHRPRGRPLKIQIDMGLEGKDEEYDKVKVKSGIL